MARKSRIHNTEAWGTYLTALAYLHTNELDAASHHFALAAERRYVLETQAAIDALAGLALAQQLMQRPDDAQETMDRLMDFAREMNAPQYLNVAQSCRARLALLQGDLSSAVGWARTMTGIPGSADLFLWIEVPSITRARVWIAVGSEESLEKATDLLRDIRRVSEACRYTCQTIEVTVLQSLAFERQGRTDEAQMALKEAVALARPGGWIRPFVEAGPVTKRLLESLGGKGEDEGFIRQVLAAFEYEGAVAPTKTSPTPRAEPSPTTGMPEPDALTNREFDILVLLANAPEQGDCGPAVHLDPHRERSPQAHLPEARCHQPRRSGGPRRRMGF